MRTLHVIGVAAGVAALVAWQPAFAQEAYDPETEVEVEEEAYEPMDVEVDVEEEEAEFESEVYEPGMITGVGVLLQVGGGIMDFTDQQARDLTATGGAWSARAIIGTTSPVGFEANYSGSAMALNARGVDSGSALVSNGAHGAIRFHLTQQPLQPYLLAGAGWRRYDVTNTDINTSALRNDDNIFEVPLGAGLAYRLGGFTADARFDYRLAFDDELIRSPVDDPDEVGNGLDSWAVTLNLGVEF